MSGIRPADLLRHLAGGDAEAPDRDLLRRYVSTRDHAVLFGRVLAVGGGTTLAVAHDARGRAVRVTSVDKDGREHTAGVTTRGTNTLTLMDAEFYLPPNRLREYRFQTRPYEWAEFRDVPLTPPGADR